MTIEKALILGSRFLSRHLRAADFKDFPFLQSFDVQTDFKIKRPRLECEIFLSHILGCNRVFLHLNNKDLVLSQAALKIFFSMLNRRIEATPLEYITQKVEFFQSYFFVNEDVLIPRSESEILVELAIRLIEIEGINSFYEIGVGSGAIALSILKYFQNKNMNCLDSKNAAFSSDFVKCSASDISLNALMVARINAEKLNIQNIDFFHSNLLDHIEKIEQNSLLISNPPYVSNNYPLDICVRNEPSVALFGGEVGDEILKKIIHLASEKEFKFLICEMGFDQRESMEKELSRYGFSYNFYRDLAGLDRGFVATRSDIYIS